MNRFLPKHIRFILQVYLLGIACFTLMRGALFLTQWERFLALPGGERVGLILRSFVMGWRFDTVISGYLLSLPIVVLTFAAWLKIDKRRLYNWVAGFIGFGYSIALFIVVANIPYFDYFSEHLSTVAFNWFNTPDFVVNMILDELIYVLLIIGVLIFIVLIILIINRFKQRTLVLTGELFPFKRLVLVSLGFMLVTFVGIRGRLDKKSPIRTGTAAFSSHALPNQLGLNPCFTLIRSFLDDLKPENKVLQYMKDEEAFTKVKKYLNIPDSISYSSPIARPVHPTTAPKEMNVVVILLESMSAQKMTRFGGSNALTPFLDSLARVGQSFDSVYTAGIHTFNGLYSTLYGFPALMKQHSMNVVNIPQYTGLPNTLKDKGYQTIHFMTHDRQFDNVAGFFTSNGFDEVISKKDYPEDQVKSTLGVPDHYMFDFALPKLNQLSANGQPFFASFMTTSDHIPYIIPEGLPYTPKDLPINQQIIEYVDWSLNQFFEKSSKESWFENTVFLVLADHGQLVHPIYDMPLTYHHSPFIIYCPKLFPKPKSYGKSGLQIDAFPTLMGVLNFPYVNNTLGIDLFKEDRPFAYFSADNKYGVLNANYYLVVRKTGVENLYRYKDKSTTDHKDRNEELVKEMKEYAETMFHTTQWMILKEQTGEME